MEERDTVEIVDHAKTDDAIQALGETGNPEFGIVRALGLTLPAHPAARGPTSRRAGSPEQGSRAGQYVGTT
jgi:hypothetical protein